jgi:predicted Zn-dependent peptidase
MPVNKTTLSNGVRILTHTLPHVRTVSTGVWVNVGARDESTGESGLSHFIEHMIFKGTARRSAYQIAKEFDVIGGHTNAFTAMETTCYYAKVMDSHLNTMADILSDVFLNSAFDPDELERERMVISHEMGMMEDTPEEYVHVLSEGHHWGEHPLGRPIIGSQENILRITSGDIKDFFHRFYQPDRIVIAAAGNLEHGHLVDLMGPDFETIRPGNGLPKRTAPVGCSGVFLHERDLEQTHLCLETRGLSITDPRRYEISLLSTILGGNMSSRLFQEIRERRGLAYSVYSFPTPYEDTGTFGVYVATRQENALECADLLSRSLQTMKEKLVNADELQDAKEYTKASLLMASESVDNLMVILAQNEIHLNQYIPIEQVLEKIDAVTREDLTVLARELFQPDPMTLTLLGPIQDEKPFGDLLAAF